MPVDFGLKVVTASLPGSDFAPDGRDAVDAPVQALADHDIDLDFYRSHSALAFSGVNASYSEPGVWVFRLSMTSVMRSASG